MDSALFKLLRDGHAVSTNNATRTALSHFDSFCFTQSRAPLALPRFDGDLSATLHNEYTFMLFAVFLVERGRTGNRTMLANTILSYCSLLRSHFSTMYGTPFSTDTPRWKKLVKALRKRYTRIRKECRALRASHLRNAFNGVFAATDTASANQWALATASWQGLLRPSEAIRLMRSDLSFMKTTNGDFAVLMVLPLKKRAATAKVPILIAAGDGSGADTYAALLRLVTYDPVPQHLQPHTALFRTRYGAKYSRSGITQLVQHIAHAAGEGTDTRLFSGRSLRIGGATELHAIGADELTIRLLGRWGSDIGRIYTRLSAHTVLNLSAQMSRAAYAPALEDIIPGFVQPGA